MSTSSPPAHLATARSLARTALDRMFTKAIRVRLVIAPVLASLALTFAFFEPTLWRRCVMIGALVVLVGLSLVEWLRYLKFGLSAILFPVNVLLTVLAQLALISASGGLFSPVMPAVLMMIVLTALLSELSTLLALLSIALPYVWLLAFAHARSFPVPSLVPELFGGAQPFEDSIAPFVAAFFYSLVFGASARVGRALQQLFDELFVEALQERDRSLALHAEQSRTLTVLTSEIAHELKNPLASVKGLAALVAKDVHGRAAERNNVLRQEVDRMQTILDEFLNFSRPLVPLSLASTDLTSLARDVARLHEGMARERGVTIEVAATGPAQQPCDPRKIRQVLINLVQNALEASPREGRVELRVDKQRDGVQIQVVDQGPGLSPQLGERVFEAGVTSKEHGSGIGLVVARSLARQHGGELQLDAGAQGGLVASLSLPRDPSTSGVNA